MIAGFFAMGLFPVDSLDSVVLRSARIFRTKGSRYLSYALSGVALTIATFESFAAITNQKFAAITNQNIVPLLTGPVLAIIIIAGVFGYIFVTRKTRILDQTLSPRPSHYDDI